MISLHVILVAFFRNRHLTQTADLVTFLNMLIERTQKIETFATGHTNVTIFSSFEFLSFFNSPMSSFFEMGVQNLLTLINSMTFFAIKQFDIVSCIWI